MKIHINKHSFPVFPSIDFSLYAYILRRGNQYCLIKGVCHAPAGNREPVPHIPHRVVCRKIQSFRKYVYCRRMYGGNGMEIYNRQIIPSAGGRRFQKSRSF